MQLSRGCSARHVLQRPATGGRGGSNHVVFHRAMRMYSCANVQMAQQARTCGTLCLRRSCVRVPALRQRCAPRSPSVTVQCALPATESGTKGLAGSKLPPRQPKIPEAAGAAAEEQGSSQPKPRIRRRTGPPRAPPPVRPSVEQSLASLLAFSGLTGTVAVVVGAVAHVNPFHTFTFSVHDIQVGMQFMLPVFLANAALLLPQYSTWELPAGPGAPAPGLGDTPSGDISSTNSSSSSSSHLHDGLVAPTTLGTSSAAATQGTTAVSSGQLPAPSTSGRAPLTAMTDPSPTQQLIKQVRSTLHFAQSHYLGGTVAGQLPLGVEAAVLGVECLAAEMLYRAVALQALGGWLMDRWYEAGWEAPQGPWAHLAAGATDTQLAQGGALAVLTGLSGLLVLQRMARAARRAPFMAALQQQLDVEQQQQRAGSTRSTQQGQEQEAAAGMPPSAPPLSPSAAAAAAAVQQAQQGSPQQQQQQAPGAAPSAPTAALGQLLAAASDAMVWSRGVQGLRDCSQFAALGITYVVTGNLAACYVVALVHELQMTVLQRYARARLRERSIAFAAKLSDMNKRLRLHARNRRSSGAAGADTMPSSNSSSSDSASAGARHRANAPHLLSPGSVMEGLQLRQVGDAMNSSVGSAPLAAGLISREGAGAAAAPVAAAVSDPVVATWEDATGSLSGAAVEQAAMATSLEKTINALDSLLGQLEEQPAA